MLFTKDDAKLVRKDIIEMSYNAQKGHVASALSMVDFLGILFEEKINPSEYKFILGKPFGAQAYYSLFGFYGWIKCDYSNFGTLNETMRYIIQSTHPLVTFIDETMGNCLSVAIGIALAGKRAFVNMSDAAFQEGTIWESLLFAGTKKLDNLIVSVDHNNMQALGKISDILPIDPLFDKVKNFGWDAFVCDGHDYEKIRECVQKVMTSPSKSPKIIVFNTIKGKGVSFMENDSSWHYRTLDKEHFTIAMEELS